MDRSFGLALSPEEPRPHAHESRFAGNGAFAPRRSFFGGTQVSLAPQPPAHVNGAANRTVPLAYVLDQTSDAICVCGLGGVIEYWNRAAEALYGWRAEEAVGRVAQALLKTVYPAPLERIEAELRRTGGWQGELLHTKNDGTRVTVASRWALQRDDAGTPVAVIEADTDITDNKRLEAERVELEERLRQAEKMEAIGRCASGIAHDFNNILGAILGYGEAAQGKASSGRPVTDELEQVMLAGHRGRRLVEHILAFSRGRTGEREPVHVQSVVDETLRLVEVSLPAGVRLERKLGIGDAALAGDATLLHQVAMNLCTNAIHSMPRGGVIAVRLDIVAVVEPRVFSHGVLQPGEHVCLVVSDTGTGIPCRVQDRIFDPFFTTKGIGKGTGLGLSLVLGIVTDWNGAIEVVSREGTGTTFTVWLPTCGETAPPRVQVAADLPQGHGEAVMVVDAEPPLVRLAEETLAQLGYEPYGFHSSRAALEAFAADPERFDLVLADELMPELTGSQLAREIRRLRPDVPVMLMSGCCGPRPSAAAQAAGVDGILHKPLLSRDIAESLAHALCARPEAPEPSVSSHPS